MENDDLKSLWKELKMPEKDQTELSTMLKEQNHPVLRSIKRQAIFEFLALAAFLFCYYTMFDGNKKPLLINLILVFAIAFNMLNHLKIYRLQQNFRAGSNLLNDVSSFAEKLKTSQIQTIMSKVILAIGLILFFTDGIELNEKKWYAIAVIVVIFMLQLLLLNKIWQKRVREIKLTIIELEKV